MSPPPANLAFAELVRRYAEQGIPRASTCRTPAQLLDLVVRHALYLDAKLSYAEAMHAVLEADRELKELYAWS